MIVCKRCEDGIAKLPDSSVQCIVTSPPYNKGNGSGAKVGNNIWKGFRIDYDTHDDNMSESDYREWMINTFSSMFRVVKDGGSLFINHKAIIKNRKTIFPDWIFEIRDFSLYQIMIWDRQCSCNIRKEVFYPRTEYIFWLVKGKPKTHKDRCEMKSDIWRMIPDRNNNHPATFPISLPLNCIRMTADVSDLVLDPFAGSGTTGIAAKICGCRFVGYEISENYTKQANERIALFNVFDFNNREAQRIAKEGEAK